MAFAGREELLGITHQGRASRVSDVDLDNQSLPLEEAHKDGLGVK